jgi:hypothetical protein
MTPADEPTPTDDATEETTVEETTVEDTTVEDTEPASTDDEGVEAEATLLDKSQSAIDEAREAVKKVAATDAIGEDATGAGDLPAFADSTEGVEQPDPDDA